MNRGPITQPATFLSFLITDIIIRINLEKTILKLVSAGCFVSLRAVPNVLQGGRKTPADSIRSADLSPMIKWLAME